MRRLAFAAGALALLVAVVAMLGSAGVFSVEESAAELDGNIFRSPQHRVRIVVPRGWRKTDEPSYPGLLLWMMPPTRPPAQIVLTAETFTRELYCSWSPACRAMPTNTARYACALREKLAAQKMRVGPTQLGPKENDQVGLPSLLFEYDDNRRFLRHAVTVTEDRAFSLVLSAQTSEARATYVRTFDQTLRTLVPLTAAEAAAPIAAQARPDAGLTVAVDAALHDAIALPTDAAPLDAGVVFETQPNTKINPIGPCPSGK
jgi:hypothetical protein